MHVVEKQRTPEPETRSASGLFGYVEIMFRRWKLIVAVTAAGTLGTVGYTLMVPNTYTAKIKFLPPQQQSGLLSAAMMQGALAAIGGDIQTDSKISRLYVEMLKIESLRDPLIDRFQLQKVYDCKYREDVYRALSSRVEITSGKEGIVTVAVDDRDPKRAAALANGMVEELKKLTTRMTMNGAGNSKAFLEERMAQAKEELTQAENSLRAFQQKYKTTDATQQAALSASATAQLAAQLTSQELQLSVLRRTYADSSQTVKSVQQTIDALKEKIARLQGSGTSALPGFEGLPQRGQEFLHLMRRFKTAEAVNEMLAKQYEMAKLNAENDVSSIQVIQKALVPERKSKPARTRLVLTSLLISLLGSLLIALGVESLARLPEASKTQWKGLLRRS